MKKLLFASIVLFCSCSNTSDRSIDLIIRQNNLIDSLTAKIISGNKREVDLQEENEKIYRDYLQFTQIHMYCKLIEDDDNHDHLIRFTIKDTDGNLHKLKYQPK